MLARLAEGCGLHGLGLVIAGQLVEALGGMLSVQSAPGSGSVFTAWLNRAEPVAAHTLRPLSVL